MDRFNGLDVPESLRDVLEPATLALVVYDMLFPHSTHPNEVGSRFLADLVDQALRSAQAG